MDIKMDINKDNCPICQDPLQLPGNQHMCMDWDNFLLTTPCNHYYHAKCIEEWFNMGNDCCPKCSRVTNEDELFPAKVHIKMQILEKFSKECEISMKRDLLTGPHLIAAIARDAEEKAKAAKEAVKAAEEAEKAAQEEEEIREGGER